MPKKKTGLVSSTQSSQQFSVLLKYLFVLVKEGLKTKPQVDNSRMEITQLAQFNLSSSKHGNGLDQLLDDDTSKYWQSDGAQPHFIELYFNKAQRVSELWIYVDYKVDESYTPIKILLKYQSMLSEICDYCIYDFENPQGWFKMELTSKSKINTSNK